ncbi:MAG: S24 family peptidase [Patescibacteria group bacterium]|nr:S24 family peptidase [Patescibacteria group bacterium]
MHPIQKRLLKLSQSKNLAQISLRAIAKLINRPKESPQKIKHHLQQLQKKGFFTIDRTRGIIKRTVMDSSLARGVVKKAKKLFSIPIINLLSYDPNNIFSEDNIEGFLRISNKFIKKAIPQGLFAVKVNDNSLHNNKINGKRIEEGDYVIIDTKEQKAKNNDIILVLLEDYIGLKKYLLNFANNEILLTSGAKSDREPIYLHPDDNIKIGGKVITVLKN